MPSLELLDVIQHAKPHVRDIDVVRTANSLKTASGSLNNYNMAVEQIAACCSGLLKLADLEAYLRTHPNESWHKHLVDVGARLHKIFGSQPSRWYPVGRKPILSAGGLLIKPSIRGFSVHEGRAYPCLINARGSVFLSADANLPFVARGVYEFHVRDEIGVEGPMIVDLGRDPASGSRANRVHFPDTAEMMTLEEFEDIFRKFNEALKMAGFKPRTMTSATDLFRTSV